MLARRTEKITKSIRLQEAVNEFFYNTPDDLRTWLYWYFKHTVMIAAGFQKERRRDPNLLFQYMELTEKTDQCSRWTPRLSEFFRNYIRQLRAKVRRVVGLTEQSTGNRHA